MTEIDDEEVVLLNLQKEIEAEMEKIFEMEKARFSTERTDVSGPYEAFFVGLEKRKYEGFSTDIVLPKEALAAGLSNELESLKLELRKTIDRMVRNKEKEDSLKKYISDLEGILNAKVSGQEEVEKQEKMSQIKRNVDKCFIKEKMELRTLIDTIFPDNIDLQDIIASCVQLYFSKGGEEYFKIVDSNMDVLNIEPLLRSGLFEVHPTDPLQIKLIDLH